MNKRLFRSDTDRVFGGVCGGLAEYLGIPAIILRIFFILWMILGEFSFFIYAILWVIIPVEGDTSTFHSEDLGFRLRQIGQEVSDIFHQPDSQIITYAGAGLIVWGVYRLIAQTGIRILPVGYDQYVWPVLLIIAGAFVLFKALKRKK
ncbi:PspC domain-containing protein [Pelolinea submarina]|uniref:Phage shock protein C (PspC) family protein n=1 Tax=Pelolinea submarina TaxID=913107 RepID=A0A3E0AAU3_9CHLR|nr:PspC domain-containing protein [Pelolinea submarina]REG08441.1 phage shock protein C (PspC) family protein [Pelolinea submarina]